MTRDDSGLYEATQEVPGQWTYVDLSFPNVTVYFAQTAQNWLYHDSQSRYQLASKFKDGSAKSIRLGRYLHH